MPHGPLQRAILGLARERAKRRPTRRAFTALDVLGVTLGLDEAGVPPASKGQWGSVHRALRGLVEDGHLADLGRNGFRLSRHHYVLREAAVGHRAIEGSGEGQGASPGAGEPGS